MNERLISTTPTTQPSSEPKKVDPALVDAAWKEATDSLARVRHQIRMAPDPANMRKKTHYR